MGSLRIVLKVLIKTAFVLGVAFELFGCAAPAVTVATIAADGASYAASGKSLGDHALSAVSGQDCSTLGVLRDGVLCRERGNTVVQVENEAPPFAAAPPSPPPPQIDNSEATFLALGAFSDWENADHIVVMGRFYNPLIVPLDVDAKGRSNPSFWVVAGHPLAGGEGAVPVAQAKSIGFAGARTVALCRATYRPAPCDSPASDPTADSAAAKVAVASKLAAAQRPGTSLAQRVER